MIFHLFHLYVQTKTLGHSLLGSGPTPTGIDSSLKQGTNSESFRKKKVRGSQEQCLQVSITCCGAEHGGPGSYLSSSRGSTHPINPRFCSFCPLSLPWVGIPVKLSPGCHTKQKAVCVPRQLGSTAGVRFLGPKCECSLGLFWYSPGRSPLHSLRLSSLAFAFHSKSLKKCFKVVLRALWVQ